MHLEECLLILEVRNVPKMHKSGTAKIYLFFENYKIV